MLNGLRRRPPPQPSSRGVDYGYLACYGIVVVCASLLLLTILAATVSIGKACALSGAVAVAFGLMGCISKWCAGDDASAAAGAPVPPATGRPCGGGVAVDVLPAFAYATDEEGESSKAARRALCPVCLEDVQAGEMVRRLPACRHLFHVGCIDMWLRSHRTCPLCRCDVWAQPGEPKAMPTPEPAEPPDNNALPPV